MAEEFQESEVMFQQEHVENHGCEFPGGHLINSRELRNSKAKRNNNLKNTSSSSSLPVNIPEANRWFQYVGQGFFDKDGCGDDEAEIVPPHVIVGQRIAGKMTSFSVCTGNGRTLKGRDLSQVRNSILRMTGFLET